MARATSQGDRRSGSPDGHFSGADGRLETAEQGPHGRGVGAAEVAQFKFQAGAAAGAKAA